MFKTPECKEFERHKELSFRLGEMMQETGKAEIKRRFFDTGLVNADEWRYLGQLNRRSIDITIEYLELMHRDERQEPTQRGKDPNRI